MQAIYNEIHALRSDLKSEMSEFRRSFRNDMKKELNEFRATGELQATIARVAETEQRISDIEEWDTAAKEALTHALESQEALQAKLTELEARSCRNNLRIYGVNKIRSCPAGRGHGPRNTALPLGPCPKASPRRTA